MARSAADWERLLHEHGVPCAIVQRVSEAVNHPQTAALGMLADVDHPDIDGFRLPALPLSLDGVRTHPIGPPPSQEQSASSAGSTDPVESAD